MVDKLRAEIGWRSAGTATAQALPALVSAGWRQCGTCWGGRLIYVPDGEGVLRGYPCAHCLGIGEVLG